MSVMEYRVWGPPGTGKTTWLSGQIAKAAESRGSDNVMVTSFTRAAAHELVSRGLPIPRENVGTLHAICYHALGRPVIAETKIAEWNDYAPQPLQLSAGDNRSLDDPLVEQTVKAAGDELMGRYQLLRNKMTPPEVWPDDVQLMHKFWSRWCAENNYVDFTGMLERARDFYAAPGEPEVLFLDEAQDCVPLQWSVLRQWADRCEMFIAAGDDDQLLYSWIGASPDYMLEPPIPEDRMRVLKQSYRVPQSILDFSQRWIEGIKKRWPKEYAARIDAGGAPVIGSVIQEGVARWNSPTGVLPIIERALKDGRRIMVLASCSYMLRPLVSELRLRGIPFHNPYRRSNGSWNPLSAGRGVSGRERLLAFLRPSRAVWNNDSRWWTWEDMHKWASLLKAKGIFKDGGRAALSKLASEKPDETSDLNYLLNTVFEQQALDNAIEQDVGWLKGALLASGIKTLTFPLAVLEHSGGEALREEPKCIVGTIHSVKGGEADEVLLFPDLSPQGMTQWLGGEAGRDAIRRMFYVGMTRARSNLYLGVPSSPLAVDLAA